MGQNLIKPAVIPLGDNADRPVLTAHLVHQCYGLRYRRVRPFVSWKNSRHVIGNAIAVQAEADPDIQVLKAFQELPVEQRSVGLGAEGELSPRSLGSLSAIGHDPLEEFRLQAYLATCGIPR